MKHETFEEYLYRKFSPKSAKTYLFVATNFINTNPSAERYQYKDILDHFVMLKKRYPKVSTRNNILAAIKKYYDYLIEIGKRNDHPCKTFRVRGEKGVKRNQIQFQDLFTPGELDALLDRENRFEHTYVRNKIIISLLIYQGLTSDEITRIDVSNVDLDNSTVYIKSSAKLNNRTMKLQRLQAEWIADYLKNHRKKLLKVSSAKLLIGIRGTPETVDSIGGMLEPLKALYPERLLNVKTIRASVIANWLNVHKHRLEVVQEWAGHKWPSSTLRYKRLDLNELREKVNKWHPLK